jgi:hypothetical protein
MQLINVGKIEGTKTVDDSTPVRAAIKVAGGEVTFRRNQSRWIKVTPVGRATAYEFVKA